MKSLILRMCDALRHMLASSGLETGKPLSVQLSHLLDAKLLKHMIINLSGKVVKVICGGESIHMQ